MAPTITHHQSPNYHYPLDPWIITEHVFDPAHMAQSETMFALGNGYIGLRGNFEEDFFDFSRGTFLNGFYESVPIHYHEPGWGYAKNTQTMLNVSDGKKIFMWIDDEPFHLGNGEILNYERTLDMRTGILTRTVKWVSPKGKMIDLTARRFVSQGFKHLAGFEYHVRVGDPCRITVRSVLEGKVSNQTLANDPRIGSHLKGQALQIKRASVSHTFGAIEQVTKSSAFHLVSAMENKMTTKCPFHFEAGKEKTSVSISFYVEAGPDDEIKLEKYLSYCSSRDFPKDELTSQAQKVVAEARAANFELFAQRNAAFLDDFWERSDVKIEGDLAVQQSVRFCIFHLLQAAGRDGRTSIPAKGMTGEGYEGHYFWDTEIFAHPFFVYTNPSTARRLMEYRIRTLDGARKRASEMPHKGAMYPWRTIDGEECSSYFPAGTAQYHLNADIVYALRKYVEITNDEQLLLEGGAEMVFETARLWADLGHYNPLHSDRFCINGVTGPDEYTAIVNNNFFTNSMAKDHLEYAVRLQQWMKKNHPEEYRALQEKIALEQQETEAWAQYAKDMYLPYSEALGVHAQDDTFLEKKRWESGEGKPDLSPLLLYYHPLVIYRHQIIKQPDVEQAMFLLSHRFSFEQKRRNYEYYDPITTGDSSLASSVRSICASEAGYPSDAYKYFMEVMRIDLDDTHGNTHHGVHMAAMAGTWSALVYGFLGLRDNDGELKLHPTLPEAWQSMELTLQARGNQVHVRMEPKRLELKLVAGERLELLVFGTEVQLVAENPMVLEISLGDLPPESTTATIVKSST